MNSKQTHTHTTHEEHCKCGENCACHKPTCFTKFLTPAAILAGALLISGSILSTSFNMPCKKGMAAKMGAQSSVSLNKSFQDYIAKNPTVIIDSLDKHYRAEQAKAQKAQQVEADKRLVDEILADKTNHVLGNPNGKFVIIEFFDYNCGWCKKTNKEI